MTLKCKTGPYDRTGRKLLLPLLIRSMILLLFFCEVETDKIIGGKELKMLRVVGALILRRVVNNEVREKALMLLFQALNFDNIGIADTLNTAYTMLGVILLIWYSAILISRSADPKIQFVTAIPLPYTLLITAVFRCWLFQTSCNRLLII